MGEEGEKNEEEEEEEMTHVYSHEMENYLREVGWGVDIPSRARSMGAFMKHFSTVRCGASRLVAAGMAHRVRKLQEYAHSETL